MNVSLTPELEKFIAKEVRDGLYQTASEVVRAGLRRLKDDQNASLPKVPDTLEELELMLLKSMDEVERGEVIDGKESLRLMRRRIKKALKNG